MKWSTVKKAVPVGNRGIEITMSCGHTVIRSFRELVKTVEGRPEQMEGNGYVCPRCDDMEEGGASREEVGV